jgi:hypothetical protein
MKLQSLIAMALAATMGCAILAQSPGEKTESAAPANAISDAALGEKLAVYAGRLKHGSMEDRREAVVALGRIGERGKAAAPALAEALNYEDATDAITAHHHGLPAPKLLPGS